MRSPQQRQRPSRPEGMEMVQVDWQVAIQIADTRTVRLTYHLCNSGLQFDVVNKGRGTQRPEKRAVYNRSAIAVTAVFLRLTRMSASRRVYCGDVASNAAVSAGTVPHGGMGGEQEVLQAPGAKNA